VKTSSEAPQIGSLIENLHEVVNGLERRGNKKRIRSLGENFPWRRLGQAIRVKTSMRHPSCFRKKAKRKKKKEKKKRKKKTGLIFVKNCRLQ